MGISKAEVKLNEPDAEFAPGAMSLGDVAIVTFVPTGHVGVEVGDPAMMDSDRRLVFFTRKMHGSGKADYRLRKLRPGETITITGQ